MIKYIRPAKHVLLATAFLGCAACNEKTVAPEERTPTSGVETEIGVTTCSYKESISHHILLDTAMGLNTFTRADWELEQPARSGMSNDERSSYKMGRAAELQRQFLEELSAVQRESTARSEAQRLLESAYLKRHFDSKPISECQKEELRVGLWLEAKIAYAASAIENAANEAAQNHR